MAWPSIWTSLSVLCLGSIVSAASLQSELGEAGITAVFPSNPDYANASQPFNLRFLSNHPAAVTYPSSAQQVSEIVRVANQFDLHVVARSGGHSYIANGLGGANGSLVVDMGNLTRISVDPTTFHAVIETGNRLGDVALALNGHGRALPHGTCSYVGVGGHSGYGGFGFTSRMWGLMLDTIISAEVVLANGSLVTASETQNSDLFWAIRGSAPSMVITTAITFKTFPVPEFSIIFQYGWQLTMQGAADALGLFQSFVEEKNLPPEFGTEIVLTRGHVMGNVSFGITVSWYGAKEDTNKTIQPFLDAMPPFDSVSFQGNGTWIDNVAIFAGQALNTSTASDVTDTFYAKSVMTPESAPMNNASRVALMSSLAHEGFTTTTGWFMELELYGGANSAINAVPMDATAYAHRNKQLTMQFYTSAPGNVPPFPAEGFHFLDGLVANLTSAMPPNWPFGAYVNYIDDRLANWQELYFGAHYPRLEALKQKYDPRDVFRFPLSIQE